MMSSSSSSPDTACGSSTEESGGEGGAATATAAGAMVHASQINDADVLFGRGGKSNPGNAAFRMLVADHAGEYSRVKRARKTQISRQLIEEVASRGGRFLVAVKDSQAPKGGKLPGGGEGGDPVQPQWKVAKWWEVATDAVAMEKAKQSLRDTAAKDAPAKNASGAGGTSSSSSDASPAKQGKKKKQSSPTSTDAGTEGRSGHQKQGQVLKQPPQHPPQKEREVVKTSFVTATATTTTTTTTITTTTTHTTTTAPEAPSFRPEVQDFEEMLNLLSDDEDGNVEQALEECLGGGDISVNLSAAAEDLLHQSPTPLPYAPADDPPSIRPGGITRSISSGKNGGGAATSSTRTAVGATLDLPSLTAHAAVSPVDSFAPAGGDGYTIPPVDNGIDIMPTRPPHQQQINLAMMPSSYYQQQGDGQNGSGDRTSVRVKPVKSRTIATGRIANDDEDLQKILGWFREDEKAESPGISSAPDAESKSRAGGSSGYYSESSSASISSPSHASASHSQLQTGSASGYITSPEIDSPAGGQMHNGGVGLSFPHLLPIAEGMAMPLPSTGIPTNNLSTGAMPVGVAPYAAGAPLPPVPQDTFTPQNLSMVASNNPIVTGMPASFVSDQQQQQQQPILNRGFIHQQQQPFPQETFTPQELSMVAPNNPIGTGMPASFVSDQQQQGQRQRQQQQILNGGFIQQQLHQQQQQPMIMNQSLPAFGEQPNIQGFQQHQRANPNTIGVQQGAPKRARYEEPAPTTDRLAPLYEWGTELDEVTQNCLEYSLPVTLPALSWLLGYSRAGIWFCILTVVFHTLESAITNFGPRTQRFRFPFAPLDPVTHMFIDSAIIWGHSLIYALFPHHFGPHPYILSFCIWCTLPYYVASSYKTHVYKVRREEFMASNESDSCSNEKEVGDEATIGSAGAEVLSSDDSSSTTFSSRSAEAEGLHHNMPHLVEENDAPEISRGKPSSSSSSPLEYAHVRYGRKVVLVKWKEA